VPAQAYSRSPLLVLTCPPPPCIRCWNRQLPPLSNVCSPRLHTRKMASLHHASCALGAAAGPQGRSCSHRPLAPPPPAVLRPPRRHQRCAPPRAAESDGNGAASAPAPAPVGTERTGPNFTAVSDINRIMGTLPHRWACFGRSQRCRMLRTPTHTATRDPASGACVHARGGAGPAPSGARSGRCARMRQPSRAHASTQWELRGCVPPPVAQSAEQQPAVCRSRSVPHPLALPLHTRVCVHSHARR